MTATVALETSARSPILAIDGLCVSYDGTPALRDVNVRLHAGECLAVLGPNGSGKSSLAKCIAGDLKPAAGSVTFRGASIGGRSPDKIARSGLVFVPEGHSVLAGLSVADNLRVAVRRAKGRPEQGRALDDIYDRFPRLRERRKQIAGTLSGGERRMLALAHVLAIPPDVLVVDELSLGLAPQFVDMVYERLAEVRAAGITLVLIEQFVERALALADKVLLLRHGHVDFYGAVGADAAQNLDYFVVNNEAE